MVRVSSLGYFLFLAERCRAVWDFDLHHVGIEALHLVDGLMKQNVETIWGRDGCVEGSRI